jgi:hypothetical protein
LARLHDMAIAIAAITSIGAPEQPDWENPEHRCCC